MGRHEVVSFEAPRLGRAWRFCLFESSGRVDGPRVVLYLLHGNGAHEHAWTPGLEVIDRMVEAGRIPPVYAVAPLTGTSWWVDGVEPFEAAFFEDLVPFVEQTYPVRADRGGRAVAGFSMGGFGALRYALTRDDLFGAAALLSPAIYHDAPPAGSSARSSGAFGDPFDLERWRALNYPAALAGHLARDRPVPMFVGAGDDEHRHADGPELDVEQQAARLFARLAKDGRRPATLRIAEGGHNWTLWAPMLEQALAYVFRFLGAPLEEEAGL